MGRGRRGGHECEKSLLCDLHLRPIVGGDHWLIHKVKQSVTYSKVAWNL